jgi:hypothetical protein
MNQEAMDREKLERENLAALLLKLRARWIGIPGNWERAPEAMKEEFRQDADAIAKWFAERDRTALLYGSHEVSHA